MLSLFAQFNNNAANQNANAAAAGFFGVFLMVFLAIFAVALIILIFFLLTMSKALSRCRPRNRTMEPGMVWLMLIPLVNLVWQFILVNRVTESLRKEYRSRGWKPQGDFGNSVGLTYCICNCLGIIPFVGYVTGLVALICWIIFWVKIAGFSSSLAKDDLDGDEGDHEDEREDDEYEDDDRAARKRKRRDDDEDDQLR